MVVVVVGASRAHMEAAWVRSEWRRFLALRYTGRKTGNLVVLLCGGMKEDQIPVGLVDCQAISTQAEKWREAIRGYLSR